MEVNKFRRRIARVVHYCFEIFDCLCRAISRTNEISEHSVAQLDIARDEFVLQEQEHFEKKCFRDRKYLPCTVSRKSICILENKFTLLGISDFIESLYVYNMEYFSLNEDLLKKNKIKHFQRFIFSKNIV